MRGEAQSPVDALIKEAQAAFAASKLEQAATIADQAIAAARQAGNEPKAAEATFILASTRFMQSRLVEGSELADRLIAWAEPAGDHDMLAKARNLLGVLRRESGDYEGAIALMTQALAHHRARENGVEQIRILRNIGTVYWQLGDLDRAQSSNSDALDLARRIGNQRFEAAVLESQGIIVMESGRFPEAIAILQRALALSESLKEDGLSLEIRVNIGVAQLDAKQFSDGLATFHGVLEHPLAKENPALHAVGFAGIGQAYASMGRLDEGLDYMRRSRSLFAELGPAAHLSLVIVLEHRLGEALRAAGRTEEALSTYRSAVALVDRMRAGAGLGASTTASVIASRNEIVTETADLLIEMDRWDEAFLLAERHRARTFLDLVAASRGTSGGGASAGQLRRQQELLAQATALQKELWSPTVTLERRRELDRQIAVVDGELERLSAEATRAAGGAGGAPALLGRSAVQQQVLNDGTVLIEYLLGEKRSFAWAISKTGVRTTILPSRKEIETKVTAYRELISRRVSTLNAASAEREYRAAAANLHADLIAPLASSLKGASRVVVVPDGVLAYLPFETLVPLGAGASLLIEQFDVSYAPSASVLGQLLADRRNRGGQPRDLFAVGDPDYVQAGAAAPASAESPDLRTRVANLGVTLTPLPFARSEVNAIGRLFAPSRRSVQVGIAARENRIKTADLGTFRYLHFAAHGVLDALRPSRSGIVLGSDASAADDGVLQVREVMTLNLSADVVTLSACETGLGRMLNGEGVVGLTRAFLQAGAHGVTVSLWNVNDAATAELMQRFYRGLRRNLRPDAALRQAKLQLLRGPRAAWRHPYFWAPFVFTGS
jgi:CHAT domain-containing protein/Tfp pilus assembly protein PilF